MIIKASCSNCKSLDSGSFLLSDFCTKHKMTILYPNKVCRYWSASLRDMDLWMVRNNEEPPTSDNSE